MQPFNITKVDDNVLRIEGFPNAVKLLKLSCAKSKRLADLTLHRGDLEFAKECLKGINLVQEEPPALREGLWRSAILHFMKCFGSNESRFSLAAKHVFKGNALAMKEFEYFKSLRDKHLVHDENAYTQCHPGAVLRNREAKHKIAKIICTAMDFSTLNQTNYGNLHQLIVDAQKWVETQSDKLCDILTEELVAVPYDELLNRESVGMRVPTVGELNKKRESFSLSGLMAPTSETEKPG